MASAYHDKYNELCARYGERQKALWRATGTPEYAVINTELQSINAEIEAHVATVHTPERQIASQIIGVPLDFTGR